MNKLVLLTGSNIGNRLSYLKQAEKLIARQIGTIIRCSSVYETAAWGNEEQASFLNQVFIVSTNYTARAVLAKILSIEKKMGRIRTKKNAPRIIDIDILFFNKEIMNEPDLQVPHPRIVVRKFVLTPLNELMPMFIHPVYEKNIHQLLLNCADLLAVKKVRLDLQ